MKEDVFYKLSSFKDWQGGEHRLVVCGVLSAPENELMLAEKCFLRDKTGTVTPTIIPVKEYEEDGHVVATLSVGFSICNPKDEWNETIGKRIAYNRATSKRLPLKWMATDAFEMFGKKVIDAVLEQKLESIVEHPEQYIVNYGTSKRLHDLKEMAKKRFANLTDSEKNLVAAAAKGCNLDHLRALAEILKGEELLLPEPQEAEEI